MSSEPKHLSENGLATLAPNPIYSGDESLPADRCVQIYRLIAHSGGEIGYT